MAFRCLKVRHCTSAVSYIAKTSCDARSIVDNNFCCRRSTFFPEASLQIAVLKGNCFSTGFMRQQQDKPTASSQKLKMQSHLKQSGISAGNIIADKINELSHSGYQVVIYVTGGGIQALPLMLAQPGASRWILEASVPYGEKSMNEILLSSPAYKEGELTGSSSVSTALVMAEAAFRRAANLSDFGTRVLGVAATCALTTDRVRRGSDRAIVAVVTGFHKIAFTLTMSKKYERSRKDQDELASLLIIEAVYSMVSQSSWKQRALDMPGEGAKPWTLVDQSMLPLEQGDDLEQNDVNFLAESGEEAIQCLLDGQVNCVEFANGHVLGNAPRSKRVYLPGSFNPLHDGHRDLLSIAESKTGMEGAFELSVMNADKGTLEAAEIWERVQQFIRAELPIVLTKSPLFTNKADLFSDSVFVVGYDTAIRLINPKYYGGSAGEMQEQFSRLSRNRCSFLVAGRLEGSNGVFLGLKDLKIPQEIKILERIFDHSMFEGISEDEFRNDISSTELRARGFNIREHTQTT